MLVVVIELEREGERAGVGERRGELENGGMVGADLGVDGPGGFLVGINRGGNGQSLLLKRCGRLHERRVELVRAAGRRDGELEVRQREVPVVRAARAVLLHRRVRQRFELHGGDAGDGRGDGEGVGVEVRVVAGDEERAVVLFREDRFALGLGRGVVQGKPGWERQPRAGFFPCGEVGRQLFLLESFQRGDERLMLPVERSLLAPMLRGIDHQVVIASHGRREGRDQPVVILRRNRIELVIMATRAADGQAEHRGADGRGHVVKFIVALLFRLVGGDLCGVCAGGKKSGGLHGKQAVRLQFVAGDLPLHEAVVGQVLVERADDEVAVVISIGPIIILLVAVTLRKTGEVEPMPAPPLAVVRTGQQAVNQPLVGVRRLVIHERLHLLRCRWQPDQIERRAADELATVEGGIGLELLRFQPGEDEPVDVVARPGFVLH